MNINRQEIKLPENPTVAELKEAAAQTRQFAEERRGQATMWDNYADVLERRAGVEKPSVSSGLSQINMEYAGLDLTGADQPTYTLRAGDIELPCGCATPCNTCQAELARHNLPPLAGAPHTAPLGHTHHWWQRCRPGCPRYHS
jgi:hypothetical protein